MHKNKGLLNADLFIFLFSEGLLMQSLPQHIFELLNIHTRNRRNHYRRQTLG
jgi:hypothetical protein